MDNIGDEKMILSLNTVEYLEEQYGMSVGWKDGKGGDTSHRLIKEEDREEIEYLFTSSKPFDRSCVTPSYNQKCNSIYNSKSLCDENLTYYIEAQLYNYEQARKFTDF